MGLAVIDDFDEVGYPAPPPRTFKIQSQKSRGMVMLNARRCGLRPEVCGGCGWLVMNGDAPCPHCR